MSETGEDAAIQMKKLHPFFSVPKALSKGDNAVTPPTPDPSCSPASEQSSNETAEDHNSRVEPVERKRKRRKTDPSRNTSDNLAGAPGSKRRTQISAGSNIVSHFGQNAANDRRASVEGAQYDKRSGEPSKRDINLPSMPALNSDVGIEHDALRGKENRGDYQATCVQKPHKVLRLNPKTGTIGSPPRAKLSVPPSNSTSRGTGSKRGRKPKSLFVTMSYGTDVESRERVGQLVDQILSGISRFIPPISTSTVSDPPPSSQSCTKTKTPTTTTPKKRSRQSTVTPKKPPHPFFQAKSKTASSTNDEGQKMLSKEKASPKRQVIYTSTPYSPRLAFPAPPNFTLPPLSSKNGRLKMPGAQYPAWPWREMVHVRDSPSVDFGKIASLNTTVAGPNKRKAKGQQIQLSDKESILYHTASGLDIRQHVEDLRSTNNEDFHPIESVVRIPIKHFESGLKLQARVFNELRTLKSSNASLKTHPAILHAYESIATTLSAFDRSTCESTAWAQKYAPTSANRVLQSGREGELLRDWLQALKVQAVDTGVSENASRPKTLLAPRRKRRRRKLEGFVVSSDEEADNTDEISENELEWLLRGGRSDCRKTVVRSGDVASREGKPHGRLTNAILLSGPHGCGKTAMVYAIAKELDFEVFEINAGARRSGKDILERVGDMTRNHLVNHQQKDDIQNDVATDDDVARDLKTGKQGVMTSFFKTKLSTGKREAKTTVPISTAQAHALQEKKSSRDQKQSLILLEEVDVLYEEDKQFWATVIAMIAQSKRPFILTCNDETVVPLQNLKLHGIFRFSSPPTDLAADLLLLIAANEGHALCRHAIEALYESRGHDLRASITELNYWCQTGVGDLRGGFDWFYPRWPKGSDIDGEGQTIRVVSQDTYHAGMGWFNRDSAITKSSLYSVVPEIHRETWDHWGLDMSDPDESKEYLSWAKRATEHASTRADRLALLESIDTFADSMSDSDICGPFLPPLSNHVLLDATTPNLHSKALDDFTVGNKLLEASLLYHYDSTSLDVSASLRILAQLRLHTSQTLIGQLDPMARFDERQATRDLEHHLKISAQSELPITRDDYGIAFDPIAASDKVLANGYLDPSVFDRTMVAISLDVAPFVRSIVSYDQRLQNERRMRSNLLSEGAKPDKKRGRTTRAAFSALEGGSRATTRREKYFSADINPYLVMRTGGKGWEELVNQSDMSKIQAGIAQEGRDADTDASSD
ncbi:hypothetical protein F5Y19DRAFT_231457 [Xylariaceae sp. FL1651]|nr:hypothetical protein F5Y19DRAFT_231457 [Xylariaceae sp. FL1651]